MWRHCQVLPSSEEMATVIGARGAPQNAWRAVDAGFTSPPCAGALPSSSISSYRERRRSVAWAALEKLKTSAIFPFRSAVAWIDELLLGNVVGVGAVHERPWSVDRLS